ncbi:MAG: hypothetical protein LM517_06675 [Nitrosomonas sp.]|nr:hypothetical protein [Nitrosomonas sp.]
MNNPGVSHENGAIENAHGSLKHSIEQAIKVRGSGDFPNLEAYRRFLDQIVDRLNKRCRGRLAQEQPHLKPLPHYRVMDFTELTVKVTTSSTIAVKRGLYSVPSSRLIGKTSGFISITTVWNALSAKHWLLRYLVCIRKKLKVVPDELITGT